MKAFSILAVLLSAVLFAVPAHAVIVGVDFNQAGAGVNQSTFKDFSPTPVTNPASQTFSTLAGNLTVTVGSASSTMDYLARTGTGNVFVNSGSFTYADLMNDFAYTAFDNNLLDVELSGSAILPNTTYTLTVWGVDTHPQGTDNTMTISPTALSGTTGTFGTIVDNGTAPVTNYSFSTTVNFTSSPSGFIDFSAAAEGGAGSERVNGFEITLPEPSSAALLLGLMPMLARRNRKTTQAAA